MIHCLHGAVGSFRDWDQFEKSLGGETRPLDLWNLPGERPLTLPEAGKIITGQADQNDVLIGYSMGGRLALHALLADPRKWRAAVIVSAHPGLSAGRAERLGTDEQWATLAAQNWDLFVEKWNQQPILASKSPGLHQATSKDQAAVAASFRSWSLGAQEDLSLRLAEITCPVLWITGARDEKFTRLACEASPLIPNSKHLAVPKAGHRIPWEQPQIFASIVREFQNANP